MDEKGERNSRVTRLDDYRDEENSLTDGPEIGTGGNIGLFEVPGSVVAVCHGFLLLGGGVTLDLNDDIPESLATFNSPSNDGNPKFRANRLNITIGGEANEENFIFEIFDEKPDPRIIITLLNFNGGITMKRQYRQDNTDTEDNTGTEGNTGTGENIAYLSDGIFTLDPGKCPPDILQCYGLFKQLTDTNDTDSSLGHPSAFETELQNTGERVSFAQLQQQLLELTPEANQDYVYDTSSVKGVEGEELAYYMVVEVPTLDNKTRPQPVSKIVFNRAPSSTDAIHDAIYTIHAYGVGSHGKPVVAYRLEPTGDSTRMDRHIVYGDSYSNLSSTPDHPTDDLISVVEAASSVLRRDKATSDSEPGDLSD